MTDPIDDIATLEYIEKEIRLRGLALTKRRVNSPYPSCSVSLEVVVWTLDKDVVMQKAEWYHEHTVKQIWVDASWRTALEAVPLYKEQQPAVAFDVNAEDVWGVGQWESIGDDQPAKGRGIITLYFYYAQIKQR